MRQYIDLIAGVLLRLVGIVLALIFSLSGEYQLATLVLAWVIVNEVI